MGLVRGETRLFKVPELRLMPGSSDAEMPRATGSGFGDLRALSNINRATLDGPALDILPVSSPQTGQIPLALR
jgi:hypothetical protein